jgi:hypothetical protein
MVTHRSTGVPMGKEMICMANKDRRPKADTGDYSATGAPENREHLESRTATSDSSQTPGGRHGAPVDVGVSALDHVKVRTRRTKK